METAKMMLAGALMRWCESILDGQSIQAAEFATHVEQHGELMVIHPDFMRMWHTLCPDLDARRVLAEWTLFMECAARAGALQERHARQFVDQMP